MTTTIVLIDDSIKTAVCTRTGSKKKKEEKLYNRTAKQAMGSGAENSFCLSVWYNAAASRL